MRHPLIPYGDRTTHAKQSLLSNAQSAGKCVILFGALTCIGSESILTHTPLVSRSDSQPVFQPVTSLAETHQSRRKTRLIPGNNATQTCALLAKVFFKILRFVANTVRASAATL